jgi:bacterioferritin
MKGNPKVLAELNNALREELTAINQYFLHAEMCENWGYHKLSEFIKKKSIGEMKHAEVRIERMIKAVNRTVLVNIIGYILQVSWNGLGR